MSLIYNCKYNDMSQVKQKGKENCQHNYCPHLHFKKCRKERQRGIPYTYRPIKEIDLTCNVHPKILNNLTTRNISTLAYEKYIGNPVLPDQEDTNFSKNFYLQNCPDEYELRNTLIKDVQEELSQQNAYVLAVGARDDYQKFDKQRKQYLINARRRADHALIQFFDEKEQKKKQSREEQARWITQYYRKVEQLKDHIFGKKNNQNDDPNVKDKMFLKEQQQNNPKKLAGIKVGDPEAAMGILVALRAVLLKKKVQLQQVRQDQQHNKSVSASYADTSNTSQNVSSASFISGASNATNTVGQSHMAQQFCDFQVLKKKWGKQSVEEVRDILRVMLCRDMINKAEGVNMREKKQAREKDEFLRKEMQKMKKGTNVKDSKGLNKTAATNRKGDVKDKAKKTYFEEIQVNSPPVPLFKEPLSKDEQIVKSKLLSGGIYDSVGNIYQRNRNYSQLFKKRAEQSLCELSFREEQGKYRATTARVGVH